ncbi:hypothetical protein Glove_326g20 [Diversispora epigaea]|uniref:Uncharacterized protein n=1 Tax=Diversispora epigaea TaxID=1348612 RepID=A0A397HS38_9GLOM|nr:hypothetical protein Glove_326g20 [Diversispora epigaea]
MENISNLAVLEISRREKTKGEVKAFHSDGQNCLCHCYRNGIGITKDSEGGNSYGQFNLGYCYEIGIEATKDEEKAFQCYLKSAKEDKFKQYFIK